MILLPLGLEDSAVRRLPWVTFSLIGACTLAFFATGFGNPPDPSREAMERAVEYFIEHPYLQLDQRLDSLLFSGTDEDTRQALLEMAITQTPEPSDDTVVAGQQQRLDALSAEAFETLGEHLYFRFGLVPNRIRPLGLLGHMFLHGGWMHLLGNMFMLFLVGPFIEDVWGRPLFAGFYLGSGVIAGLIWAARHPDLSTPLIGASGAIAGVMGAFFIRHFAHKIRFFYMAGLVIRGTFSAPAWLMLPLWLGQQVFMAMMVDGLGIEGGVAYWAHIGGFAWGAAFAFGIKQARIEERLISGKIEKKITLVDNRVIEEAQQARAEGRIDDAYTMLAGAWKQDPSNRDVALSLWDLAVSQGWAAHAVPAITRCIEQEVRDGDTAAAVEHWYEVVGQVTDVRPDPSLCLRIAGHLAEAGHQQWATDALARALANERPLPAAMAIRIANLAAPLDPQLARRAAEQALATPEIHVEERRAAEAILATLSQPVC